LSFAAASGTNFFPPSDSIVFLNETSHEVISSGFDKTKKKVCAKRRESAL
jgi:hypothetical protein